MERAHATQLLFDHPVIKKAADAHSKTPAQILLRWSTQRGIAVIPKSNNQGRLQQNLDVTSWDLKDQELKEISALNEGLRFNDPSNVRLTSETFCWTPLTLFFSTVLLACPSSCKDIRD